jgi:hypothetical protein
MSFVFICLLTKSVQGKNLSGHFQKTLKQIHNIFAPDSHSNDINCGIANPSVSMFIGQGLSLEACRAAQAERRAVDNTAMAAASAVAVVAAASTAAAVATEQFSSASSPLITIMAPTPP